MARVLERCVINLFFRRRLRELETLEWEELEKCLSTTQLNEDDALLEKWFMVTLRIFYGAD
jgi:hypothetical protein